VQRDPEELPEMPEPTPLTEPVPVVEADTVDDDEDAE